MDKWNTRIARKYVVFANQQKDYSVEQCERMLYALNVILSEMEKMIALCLIALIFGVFNYFLLAVVVVLSLRVTMGGMHRKTFWGCFLFSLCFFSSVIVLSKYVIAGWKVTNLILYGIYVIYIYFRAPIPSATRPVFSVQRKKRLKVYAFVVITGWISVCYLFQGNGVWINCIEWTLLLHIVEILFVEGGRALWQKTRLLRKSVNS